MSSRGVVCATVLLSVSLHAEETSQPRPMPDAIASTVSVDVAGGECPSAIALGRVLGPLLRTHQLTASPGRERVIAEDNGEAYGVEVGGQRRSFADPGRHCDERARMAAVFAAMALESPTAAAPLTRIDTPSTPSRTHLGIEPTAALEVLPAGAASSVSGGGSLRVVVESRERSGGWSLGGSLAAGARSPFTSTLSGRELSVVQIPIDASLRGSFRRGAVEGTLEAGLLVAIALATWQNAATTYQGGGAGAGLRAGLFLRVWLSPRCAAVVGAELDELLRSTAITECANASCASGAIRLGELPTLQLAAFAGLSVRVW